MKSVTKLLSFMLALLVLTSLPACFGQDVSGMTGEVTDKSGAAIPGVAVTLRNPGTGFKLTEYTNSIGFYRFSQIPPGQGYEATFTVKGFTPIEIKNIYLTVSTVRTQDATLSVGAHAETVEVTASELGSHHRYDGSDHRQHLRRAAAQQPSRAAEKRPNRTVHIAARSHRHGRRDGRARRSE